VAETVAAINTIPPMFSFQAVEERVCPDGQLKVVYWGIKTI